MACLAIGTENFFLDNEHCDIKEKKSLKRGVRGYIDTCEICRMFLDKGLTSINVNM